MSRGRIIGAYQPRTRRAAVADAPAVGTPPWREADRLATLRDYDIIDTTPEPAFDAYFARNGQPYSAKSVRAMLAQRLPMAQVD